MWFSERREADEVSRGSIMRPTTMMSCVFFYFPNKKPHENRMYVCESELAETKLTKGESNAASSRQSSRVAATGVKLVSRTFLSKCWYSLVATMTKSTTIN